MAKDGGTGTRKRFVGQSDLTAMILAQVRSECPGVHTVMLAFGDAEEATWGIAHVEAGRATSLVALTAANAAVDLYRIPWIMVPDGDPRDGHFMDEDGFLASPGRVTILALLKVRIRNWFFPPMLWSWQAKVRAHSLIVRFLGEWRRD